MRVYVRNTTDFGPTRDDVLRVLKAFTTASPAEMGRSGTTEPDENGFYFVLIEGKRGAYEFGEYLFAVRSPVIYLDHLNGYVPSYDELEKGEDAWQQVCYALLGMHPRSGVRP